ncbi:MAG: hypothetical protein HDQ87_02690 [Clostridia bacterium]|nr:hypothetical protein [Clostridia bacterium]
MKVDATSSLYGIDPYRNLQNRHTVQKAAAVQGSDKADVSSDAVTFAEAFASVKVEMEDHLNQVNPFVGVAKSQIAEGTYVVDFEEVASAILFFT